MDAITKTIIDYCLKKADGGSAFDVFDLMYETGYQIADLQNALAALSEQGDVIKIDSRTYQFVGDKEKYRDLFKPSANLSGEKKRKEKSDKSLRYDHIDNPEIDDDDDDFYDDDYDFDEDFDLDALLNGDDISDEEAATLPPAEFGERYADKLNRTFIWRSAGDSIYIAALGLTFKTGDKVEFRIVRSGKTVMLSDDGFTKKTLLSANNSDEGRALFKISGYAMGKPLKFTDGELRVKTALSTAIIDFTELYKAIENII